MKRVIFCRTVLTTKASKNFVFTKSKFRLSSSIDGEKTPKNPTQKDNQNEVVETNFVPTHPLGSQNYLLKSRKSQHFTRRMLTDESINLVQNLLILSPLLSQIKFCRINFVAFGTQHNSKEDNRSIGNISEQKKIKRIGFVILKELSCFSKQTN